MTVDVAFDAVLRLTALWIVFFGLAFCGRADFCRAGEASVSDGATDEAADCGLFAGDGV
jgi:hypothetical protein